MKYELNDLSSLQALVEDETDIIANLSNISAYLNEMLEDINWVGFYLNKANELVLGPFQGKVACVRIPCGKGVCGGAMAQRKVLRVENVHEFPGHIACDSASNSEIVLPIYLNDEIYGVLDIDSPKFARFSETDQAYLEQVVEIIENYVLKNG